jgi:ABC-2 type transport system permease protein
VSTLTEQPMAVTVSVMIFTILSWILDEITQVAWLHPYLLVHEWMSVADVLREPVAWEAMGRGVTVAAVYALVFWLAAWARLSSKDVTS